MKRTNGDLLLILLAAAGLFVVHRWGPGGLYTFGGHGRLVNELVHGLLWLLFLTHAGLAAILWTQRARWDDSEAGMFRFIAAKGLLWIYFALTMPRRNGVTLTTSYLYVVILLTTIDLDLALVRRYVLTRKERP